MGITPVHAVDELVEMSMEGVRAYGPDAAVYIRPMYWALDGGHMAVLPKEGIDRLLHLFGRSRDAPFERRGLAYDD